MADDCGDSGSHLGCAWKKYLPRCWDASLTHPACRLAHERSIQEAFPLQAGSPATAGLLRKGPDTRPFLCLQTPLRLQFILLRSISSFYFICPSRLPLLFILTFGDTWSDMGYVSKEFWISKAVNNTKSSNYLICKMGKVLTLKGDCEDKCKNGWNVIFTRAIWSCFKMDKTWHMSHYFFLHPSVGTNYATLIPEPAFHLGILSTHWAKKPLLVNKNSHKVLLLLCRDPALSACLSLTAGDQWGDCPQEGQGDGKVKEVPPLLVFLPCPPQWREQTWSFSFWSI